jgi:probable rRNA maturation factor
MKLRVILARGRAQLKAKGLKTKARQVCQGKNLKGQVEVSVSLVNDRQMAKLNRRFMGGTGPTDVLAFPLNQETGPDGVVRLGDVVIDYEQAKRQAQERKLSLQKETETLLEHGLRHLLGLHHDD